MRLTTSEQFPVREDDERRLDRRRFLCAAGSAAALALGGEWASRRSLARVEPPLQVTLLASAPPLDVGEGRVLGDPSGREALVVRLDEHEIVAFERRCPHLGCPVLWAAERGRFECPCHHAAFAARTGEVLFGPPRRPLTPVRIRRV